MHRLAVDTDEEREGVAALFDADASGDHGDERVGAGSSGQTAASHSVLHVLHANPVLRSLREVDHAGSVESDSGGPVCGR